MNEEEGKRERPPEASFDAIWSMSISVSHFRTYRGDQATLLTLLCLHRSLKEDDHIGECDP